MIASNADVVRHFLKAEASRSKFKSRSHEILSWCGLPDGDLMQTAKTFMHERDDINPALLYTVGSSASKISEWVRETIECKQIYTCGIAKSMRPHIESVSGNMLLFAERFSSNYPEFATRSDLPHGDEAVLIVIHQSKPNRSGIYECVDGAHRLVALCKARSETVEAYVGRVAT